MQLRSVASKTLVLVVCMAAVVCYGQIAVRQYWAYRLSRANDFARLQRAAALEPANADYRYRIANYLFLTDADLGAAIQQYRAAIAINPWVSLYWLDLSRAYLAMDKNQEQAEAVQQALDVDPTTPATIWTAANLYVAQGDQARGFELLRRYILNDPEHADRALLFCWRITHDAAVILGEVLPRSSQNYSLFLNFVIHQNDVAAAQETWARLIGLNERFPMQTGVRYVSFLILNHQPEQARDAWKQLAFLNPSLLAYLPRSNLVVNGGFEEEMLNGGWDWWYVKLPDVQLAMDTSQFHGGSRSLRIHIDGASSEAGLRQYVLVKPDTTYEFSAAYRADPLEGAHGFYFAVFDAAANTPLAVTDDVIGITPWREASVRFKTGRNTRMVMILIGHAGGDLLRGNFWVDDVRLVEP
jgi:tetratricopeptide (TPR) repeat protein